MGEITMMYFLSDQGIFEKQGARQISQCYLQILLTGENLSYI